MLRNRGLLPSYPNISISLQPGLLFDHASSREVIKQGVLTYPPIPIPPIPIPPIIMGFIIPIPPIPPIPPYHQQYPTRASGMDRNVPSSWDSSSHSFLPCLPFHPTHQPSPYPQPYHHHRIHHHRIHYGTHALQSVRDLRSSASRFITASTSHSPHPVCAIAVPKPDGTLTIIIGFIIPPIPIPPIPMPPILMPPIPPCDHELHIASAAARDQFGIEIDSGDGFDIGRTSISF